MKIKTHTLISVEGEKFFAFLNTNKYIDAAISMSGKNVYFRAYGNTRNPRCINQLHTERSRHFSAPELIPTDVQMFYSLEISNPTAMIVERRDNGRFEFRDDDRKHPLWKKYEDNTNIFKVFLNNPIR